jgi:hypothetical protein
MAEIDGIRAGGWILSQVAGNARKHMIAAAINLLIVPLVVKFHAG